MLSFRPHLHVFIRQKPLFSLLALLLITRGVTRIFCIRIGDTLLLIGGLSLDGLLRGHGLLASSTLSRSCYADLGILQVITFKWVVLLKYVST